MTDTAILSGWQVIGVFAPGGNAIVAGRAVAHDTGMIKHRTNKGGSVMTHTTIFGRSDMCDRLANRGGTVVAADTIARDPIVIEDRRKERCRVMAEVAVLRRGYMVHC